MENDGNKIGVRLLSGGSGQVQPLLKLCSLTEIYETKIANGNVLVMTIEVLETP